jgi:hypothetical protein
VHAPPAGYLRIVVGDRVAVVHQDYENDARVLLAGNSVYNNAGASPGVRALQGRGVAYAITLPNSGLAVVVRHNRHGGLFGPLTRDLFLEHTRAPYELDASVRLVRAGVATPPIVMYSEEAVFGIFRRADVVTKEIEESRDLSTFMAPDEHPKRRQAAWEAAWRLVWLMSEAGARHHDLNVKNILLSPGEDTFWKAWVLDVDRVNFYARRSPAVLQGNVQRLFRSARKWRDRRGSVFEEKEMTSLMRRAMP